jgi:hypothetical protein
MPSKVKAARGTGAMGFGDNPSRALGALYLLTTF